MKLGANSWCLDCVGMLFVDSVTVVLKNKRKHVQPSRRVNSNAPPQGLSRLQLIPSIGHGTLAAANDRWNVGKFTGKFLFFFCLTGRSNTLTW